MPQDRPQGDALFDSLAKVAEAYGGTTDVARLAGVLASLDLADVPLELATAVAETLTYVYAIDQAVETRGLPPLSEGGPGDTLTKATRQLGEAIGQTGNSILSVLGNKGPLWLKKRQ